MSADSESVYAVMEEMIAITRARIASDEIKGSMAKRDILLRDTAAMERTLSLVRYGLYDQAVTNLEG